jgi:hypothetical protein
MYGGWYISWDNFSSTINQLLLEGGNVMVVNEALFFKNDLTALMDGLNAGERNFHH